MCLKFLKKLGPDTFGLDCVYAWLKENVDVTVAVPETVHSTETSGIHTCLKVLLTVIPLHL